MILYISLALLAITILLIVIDNNADFLSDAGIAIVIILLIVAIAFSIVTVGTFIDSRVNVVAKIESKQQIYDSLTYQLDNMIFENGNTVAKKQLYDQIMEWNKDLAFGKNAIKNIWTGILYCAPEYDQFDFIHLPKIESENN